MTVIANNTISLMISDADLSAIEDYRFGNRIPSRSAAIKRLLKTGLEAVHAAALINEAREKMETEQTAPQ